MRLKLVLATACMLISSMACAVPTCRVESAKDLGIARGLPWIVIPQITRPPTIDGTLAKGEWSGASEVADFVVAGSEKPYQYPTKAWIATDGRMLYVGARCGLIDGQPPRAVTKQRDGSVWLDDAVEFYIQSGPGEHYYQFIVNAGGTRYDGRHVYERGVLKPGPSWNVDYKAKTGREKDAWTLEMAIPLFAVELKPDGLRAVRLNICRDGVWPSATWSSLRLAVLNSPQDFGVGVCTFGIPLGTSFDMARVTGWKGVGAFRVQAEKRALVLPGEFEVTANMAMPREILSSNEYFIEPKLIPLLPGGKEGKPIYAGRERVSASGPVKVLIGGMEPGEYKIKVSLSAGPFSGSQEFPVTVRQGLTEPSITGEIVLRDSDWRSDEKISSARAVEHQLTPELLLKTHFWKPVLAFDPTDDETITCMADFKGKLYVGSCTKPSVTDTGSIYTYDPDVDLWEKVFQVNEQGLAQMHVSGDRMYIPGYDANDGDWDLGNVYIHDGEHWIEKRTVPGAIHIYGMVKRRDRIYVSADILGAVPAGMSFKEALDKDLLPIYGRVMSSGDEGETWREEYRGKVQGQDISFMTAFKDQIVVNSGADLIVFDGAKWTPMHLTPRDFFAFDFQVDGDNLLIGTRDGVVIYDGQTLRQSDRMGILGNQMFVRAIEPFGDRMLLAGYHVPGSCVRHGPGTAHYPQTKDGKSIDVSGVLMVAPRKTLYERRGDDDSDWWSRMLWLGMGDLPTSCQAFRGRLYLGSHPNGKVYVLPVLPYGIFDSAPTRLGTGGKLRLWWRAATPPGTSVAFQVRTAASAEELEKKPFAGPDGSPRTYFTTPGQPFESPGGALVQYRAILKTANPALSPYVKEVVITR